MSDTTPRPDDTPADPTAPAQPADVEVTEFVPVAESATPATGPADAPAAPPAYEQPQYAQPQYAQQPPPPNAQEQLPPPAYAGAAPGTAVAAPNQLSPAEERTWGTIAHGGTLAATILSGGTLGFVCALVIYLVYKDRGPFVHHHAANALNVQITAGIAVIVGIILCVTIIGLIVGIPLIIAAGLYAIVVHLIGAIKANNGEWWDPPMTPHFVK
jgi:uncharacterized Tic20 family protein